MLIFWDYFEVFWIIFFISYWIRVQLLHSFGPEKLKSVEFLKEGVLRCSKVRNKKLLTFLQLKHSSYFFFLFVVEKSRFKSHKAIDKFSLLTSLSTDSHPQKSEICRPRFWKSCFINMSPISMGIGQCSASNKNKVVQNTYI